MTNRRAKSANETASMREMLIAAGLRPELADLIDKMPSRTIEVDQRRPFREPGVPCDDVIFVRSGILSKFKTDTSGRRQIVALRFPGEVVLPRHGTAQFGIQAIVRSEVVIARSQDFETLLDSNPELRHFFWRLLQRNEAIGYEWLINCGRRDSTARVAHLLCETSARMDGGDEHLLNPFTQQQIADITGQTSVNVNRVLADMERQGLIRRKGRDIEFSDWSEMRRVASFQPAYLEL